jgi:hypothetical protein
VTTQIDNEPTVTQSDAASFPMPKWQRTMTVGAIAATCALIFLVSSQCRAATYSVTDLFRQATHRPREFIFGGAQRFAQMVAA